jgi:tetratricopeptide (TPR) repeat protein
MRHLARVLRILLAAALFASLLHGDPAFADDPVEQAKAHHALGETALAEGKLGTARDELLKALELVPRFTDAQYALGNVYARAERWQDAIVRYEKALEIGPAHPKYHYGIGCCERALGHADKARAALAQARDAYAEVALALATGRAKGPPGRGAELTRAVVQVDLQLAALAREDGDDESVARILDRALAIEPSNAKLLAERGGLLLRRNDAKGAVSAYEKALEGAPTDLAILYSLGRALVAAGRADEGNEKLARHEGRKDAARDLAAKALQADPENALAVTVRDAAK